jgi:hypothetical protein
MKLVKIETVQNHSDSNPLDAQISLFENAYDKDSYPKTKTVLNAIKRIKEGTSESINRIKAIRLEASKDERDEMKRLLPMYYFSGVFKGRYPKDIVSYTGFVVIDFDGVKDIPQLKGTLTNDPFVFLCFISPTSTGIKAIVRTNNNDPKLHTNYWKSLRDYFNRFETVDESGKNLGRGCFESYDPQIYVNPDSKVWTEFKRDKQPQPMNRVFRDLPKELQETDQNRLFTLAIKKIQRAGIIIQPGNRDNGVFNASVIFNQYGVSFDNALSFFLQYEQRGFDRNQIIKCVRSGYSRTQYHGIIKPMEKNIYRETLRTLQKGAVS